MVFFHRYLRGHVHAGGEEPPAWWALKLYELHYAMLPVKLHVPTVRDEYQLTVEEFNTYFRKPARPVQIPFASLRGLNFTMSSYTLPQLMKKFPATAGRKPATYMTGYSKEVTRLWPSFVAASATL